MEHSRFFCVRPAEARDIPDILAIEQEMWQGQGVELYTEDHFRTWLRHNPAGFQVSLKEGCVIAYGYYQTIHFDPKNFRETFTSCDRVTDHGYTLNTHNPDGNAFYGMSVVSRVKGGGSPLLMHVIQEAKKQKKEWYIGCPRINNYAEYRAKLNSQLGPFAGHTDEENSLALSYTVASATMIGALIWWEYLGAKPKNPPIPLSSPDQVLTAHLKHPGNGLGAILPGFMTDSASHDYGILSLMKP